MSLLVCMAVVHLKSSFPVSYMRVSKSGSTTVKSLIAHNKRIRIFDHNDGCRNVEHCNGTIVDQMDGVTVAAPGTPTIVFNHN